MTYLCDMKRILTSAIIILLSFKICCIAQVSSSRFYSLDNNETERSTITDVHNENMNDSISSPSSSVQHKQNVSMEQPVHSIEELKSLIEMYERRISTRDSVKRAKPVGNNKKVHSYRQWNPRELNMKNLTDVMTEVGLSNKLFVLAQAVLETGNFSSRVCKEYNNLFGLYDSKNRDYYRFERWEDSVVGYGKMIQYRYNGGNYLHFLKRIGYAEDPRYITKIARMAKSIYNRLFSN
ncbi:MAG TPA: hypothetical protein DHU75_08190 [Rikenellaceae bacterium]|nr:hypothetical protein [Rikenellaceae bacterium]